MAKKKILKGELVETPYHIADLGYNPSRPKSPWQIRRVGTVVEQGGLCFGYETIFFQSLSDAVTYLEETTDRDLDIIKEKIANAKT